MPLWYNVIVPLVIYYLLRYFGSGALESLLLGALPLIGYQVFLFQKNGRIDILGKIALAILGVSILTAIITGSARFMLAKAGFFTAMIGCYFLLSLRFKKPLAFTLASYFFHKMNITEVHLDYLYDRNPDFRKVWRTSTLIWGIGILLNALIIFLMAYFLPVDIVPALSALIHLLIFIALQLISNLYYHKKKVWEILFKKNGF